MSSDAVNNQNANSIRMLTYPEIIRQRPFMYLGDLSKKGLYRLINELFLFSTEEAAEGNVQSLALTLHTDDSVEFFDDGPGIPITTHPTLGIPILEVLLTHWLGHAQMFDGKSWSFYLVANALSEWLHLETRQNGGIYRQEYELGVPVADIRLVGTCSDSGIRVRFKPDALIFGEAKLSALTLRERLRELAFLHSGLSVCFSDETTGTDEKFEYPDGIRSFVQLLNQDRQPLHPEILAFRGEEEGVGFEVGVQFCRIDSEIFRPFVNDGATTFGTHVSGFRKALTCTLDTFTRRSEIVNGPGLKGTANRTGLTAVLSLRLKDPQYRSATKLCLNNPEAGRVIEKHASLHLTAFFEKYPSVAEAIVQAAGKN